MNSLFKIKAYKYLDGWVFDDERRNLSQEPFISGSDEWLDKTYDFLKKTNENVILTFSSTPLPNYYDKITLCYTSDINGSWYESERYQEKIWLCPALFKYFNEAPIDIYVIVS